MENNVTGIAGMSDDTSRQPKDTGYRQGTASSDMFVKIDIAGTVVTKSKTEGYEEYESIPDMEILKQRNQANPNNTQDQVSSSRIMFSDVQTLVPMGGASINCRDACAKGSIVTAHFVRLVNDGEERKVFVEYTLSGGKIVGVDDVILSDGRQMTRVFFSVNHIVQIVHDSEGGEFNFTYSVENNKLGD